MALPDAIVELQASAPALTRPDRAIGPTVRVRVWDLPLRVFHWSLLAAVTVAIVTGKLGGDWMPWHGRAGIAIVGLLAFRLVWGLIGPTPARFASFLPTPASVLAYLQGRWRGVGHTPLGALSVLALLGLLAWQAGSGLFGNDDIAFTGPLAAQVSDELSHSLTNWHRQTAYLVYGLIGLHVLAIAVYTFIKRHGIVKPMVTGWKDVAADLPKPRRARRIALPVAVLVGAGAACAASGGWVQASAPVTAEPPKLASTGNAHSSAVPTDAAPAQPAQMRPAAAGNAPSW
jgi:cytochrome b